MFLVSFLSSLTFLISITEDAFNLPSCLKPILNVGIENNGTSVRPLELLPITPLHILIS